MDILLIWDSLDKGIYCVRTEVPISAAKYAALRLIEDYVAWITGLSPEVQGHYGDPHLPVTLQSE